MSILKEVKEIIMENLPKETQITSIEMEGPEVAIYTRNPKAFFENENFVAKIAFELKKRVNIRTDKSLLSEEEFARKTIKELVPENAGIKEIYFNPAFSEVVIESIKPGLVIGKGGETSKEIILKTGWTPNILRSPTSDSEILKGIRHHLHKYSAERKKILQETAKKIYRELSPNNGWVRLTALGGFREVGKSCMMIETPETKVLLDVGIDVANQDQPYPYLEAIRFPLDQLDAVVISHAHLDHGGLVPLLFKMGYRGPVYCSKPTRDLMALLQFDYIDVLIKEGKEPPYTERDVKEMLKYCITREYREVTDIAPDMRITLHNAAHILGSASVHFHIGEGAHNLVYSADLKFGFTRLFNNVDINYPRLETLIIESTYGGRDDIQQDRNNAEEELIRILKETMHKEGNTLIPVFSVGRAQEIMLVIEEYYRKGMLDGKVFIDGMTREASAIHTAYPEYLRKGVQRRVLQNDSPFTSDLFQTANGKERDKILEEKSAIILASAGMLTGGPSVQYFQKMAENPNNTLIFVGYQGEGSLGNRIQKGLKKTPISDNGKTRELPINMRVETVEGFSVPYDTEIFTKRNGEYEIKKIGEIADEFMQKKEEGIKEINGIKVVSFNDKGKIEMRKASHIIKHKTKGKHLKIKTKSGKEIQISKGHSLFALKEGKIFSMKGNNMKVGDHVVIASKIPESNTITEISFANYVKFDEYNLVNERARFEPKKGGNKKSFLNAECNDITSLAKFLGYYAAEGSTEKGRSYRALLSFGAHEKELIEDASQSIRNAFGIRTVPKKPHETETQLRTANKLLVRFLEKIGSGTSAYEKGIPNIVYNFPAHAQKEFIKAYFAGDGYIYKNGGKGYLAAKSVSKKLMSDLSYLLLQHGIISRMKGPYTEKERMLNGNLLKESKVYKLYIWEKELEKIERKIGYPPFALPIKEIELRKLYKNINDPKTRKLIGDYIHNSEKKKRK
ncbi:beta-CASP ribonuclease aCPSF1, partial [Candidatus Micrarchaeota archaeon]|nr:beta-CASP ribonuclease aCPSF1 [Candidatus Micrarchaeota archaeon]